MHQQTTKTRRFENLLNWCQGQVREIEFILEDAYPCTLIVLSNKIKTAITQLKD